MTPDGKTRAQMNPEGSYSPQLAALQTIDEGNDTTWRIEERVKLAAAGCIHTDMVIYHETSLDGQNYVLHCVRMAAWAPRSSRMVLL